MEHTYPELFIFQISKILPSRKAAPDSSTLQYIVIDKSFQQEYQI